MTSLTACHRVPSPHVRRQAMKGRDFAAMRPLFERYKLITPPSLEATSQMGGAYVLDGEKASCYICLMPDEPTSRVTLGWWGGGRSHRPA